MRDYLKNLRPVLPEMNQTVWIGSVNPDGTPHLSVRVVLGNDGQSRVFFSSKADSGLVANVRERRTVTICAASRVHHKGAQLLGNISVLTSGPEYETWAAAVRKMGFPADLILVFKPLLEFMVAPSPVAAAPLS